MVRKWRPVQIPKSNSNYPQIYQKRKEKYNHFFPLGDRIDFVLN